MTRGEIAFRLGLRPEQLLSRVEAAKVIGVTPQSMRAKTANFPGYYATAAGDPLYDPRVVENFTAWRNAGRPKAPRKDEPDPFALARAGGGRLPDPPFRGEANAALSLMVAAQWKAAEIARRWELTMNDLQASKRLFDDESGHLKPGRTSRLGQPMIVHLTSRFRWTRGATPPENMGALIHRYWLDILREHEEALELAMAADVLARSDE